MKIIGLTGGIASGKSTLSSYLSHELHIPVIDADTLGHQILGEKVFRQQIADALGLVLSQNLPQCRKIIAEAVFSSPDALAMLNAVMIPEIMKRVSEKAASTQAPLVVFDAALIFEHNLDKNLDAVICVLCPEKTRIKRLMAKGFSPEDAKARIVAQCDDATRVSRSDFLVYNTSASETCLRNAKLIFDYFQRRYA